MRCLLSMLVDKDSALRRHAVRAALQSLIYSRKKKSEITHRRLKIKHSENMPFRE